MNGFKRRAEKWMRPKKKKKKSGVGYRIEWKGEAGRWSRSHRAEGWKWSAQEPLCPGCLLKWILLGWYLCGPLPYSYSWVWTRLLFPVYIQDTRLWDYRNFLITGFVLGYKATAPESKQLSLWRGKGHENTHSHSFLFPSLFQLYLNLTAITNK